MNWIVQNNFIWEIVVLNKDSENGNGIEIRNEMSYINSFIIINNTIDRSNSLKTIECDCGKDIILNLVIVSFT